MSRLRFNLQTSGLDCVDWCPNETWVIARIQDGRLNRTPCGGVDAVRGLNYFQFDGYYVRCRPIEDLQPSLQFGYWSRREWVACGANDPVYLRLVPSLQNGCQLIACNAAGTPYYCGALVTLGSGVLYTHAGVNRAFGFQLTSNNSLVVI